MHVDANPDEQLFVPTEVCFLPPNDNPATPTVNESLNFTDLPQGGKYPWWSTGGHNFYQFATTYCHDNYGNDELACNADPTCHWVLDDPADPSEGGDCHDVSTNGEFLDDGFCISSTQPQISSNPSDNGITITLNFTADGYFDSYDFKILDDNGNTSDFLFDRIVFRTYYCSDVAKVVTSVGENRAWQQRIKEGSDYLVPDLLYGYNAGVTLDNYPPFGSAIPPEPIDDPAAWVGLSDVTSSPLLYMPPNKTKFDDPYQVRAGTPYSCGGNCSAPNLFSLYPTLARNTDLAAGVERLKRLFARSFGTWHWNTMDDFYEPQAILTDWDVPKNICAGNIRKVAVCHESTGVATSIPCTDDPSCQQLVGAGATCRVGGQLFDQNTNTDYCAVVPTIRSLTASPTSIITKQGFGQVNLTFSVAVDSEQLPIKAYTVDWGDATNIAVSGTSLRDRLDPSKPFELAHAYSYYDLLLRNKPTDAIYCFGETPPASFSGLGLTLQPNQCAVIPRVRVTDNWGWCNGATSLADCQITTSNAWQPLNGAVLIGIN